MSRHPHRWQKRAGRVLVLAVLMVVAVLLVRQARGTDWAAVAEALRGYGPAKLAAALGLVATSYALYAGYELLSRRQVAHGVPVPRAAAIGLVSYAFALNLGALVGGGGMRLRLYRRVGLGAAKVARLALFAVVTNWLGYCVLAGTALLLGQVPLPGAAGAEPAWRALGVAMLAAALAYLLACARWPSRRFQLRGHGFTMPRARMAVMQLLLSSLNWASLAALAWLLLPGDVAYARVLVVVLAAAMAGILLHTPAGLGAWEWVFLHAFAATLGREPVIAALLALRGLYYLLPLGVAVLGYLLLEARKAPGAGRDVSLNGGG